MNCPLCKLQSPEATRRCDCGYEFAAAYGSSSTPGDVRQATTDPSASQYLRSIDSSVRTIKIVVVAWAVLTVIGLGIWLFAGVLGLAAGVGKTP
jgi:hypothetical protein